MASSKSYKSNTKKTKSQTKTSTSKSSIKKSTRLVPITKEYKDLSIEKLNGNFINSGYLVSMHVAKEDETLYFEESWIELIVLLLSLYYIDNQTNFLNQLFKGEILNASFRISDGLIYDKDSSIKQYKIPKSNYYFETDLNGKNLSKSIKNLVKILRIESKGLSLHVIPKEEAVKNIHKKEEEKEEITFSLFEAFQHEQEDLAIKKISILNKEFICKNSSDPSVFLIHFLYKTQRTFWKDNLDKLSIDRKFIISQELEEIEKSKIRGEVFKIPETDYYFSKQYSESIETNYLLYLCNLFNISPLLINLTFEKKDGVS